MPETIDLFNPARTPYQDTDNFGIGYGTVPPGRPTYKGTLLDLANYLTKKAGSGQITLIGSANYIMHTNAGPSDPQPTDFELASSVTLTLSPTWTLVPANSQPAGTRRRFVDLAGVIVQGTYQIALAPVGTDTINGINAVYWMIMRFAYAVLETDGVSNWTVVEAGPSLRVANNLSDLANVSTARGNLGLGTAAVQPVTAFLTAANNLSELSSTASAARANLGLGALAVLSTVLYSNLDPAAIASLSQLLNGAAHLIVTTDVLWSSRTPVVIPFAAAATWDFNTFINGTYTLSANSVLTAINAKPGQQGFIVIRNASVAPAKTLTWPASGIFNFLTGTTNPIYGAINTSNLFEYWVESTSIIRTRLTTNLQGVAP